jgi:hypothetical protein
MTKGISMKTFFLGLIAASAMLVSGAVAQAGFINGGATFTATTENNTTGTVLDTRLISGVTLTTSSGDFTSAPNFTTTWQNFTLTSPMSSIDLSAAGFGTFSGTMTSDVTAGTDGNGSRTVTFAGQFSGGSLFPGKQDATLANLTYTLSDSTTGPNRILASQLLLTTFGTAAVPEPASMAIFGLGAIGFAARRFRRK